jgi:Regulator of chromosome condensation (RCC1) repeat
MRIKDVWPDDPTEDERRFNSSLALVIFARTCPDLHPEHRRRLVSEAIWFWTERGARSRKYLLRYRTVGAWERQLSMGYSNAAKHGGLAHEHVHEKAPAIDRLLVPTNDAFEVLASALAVGRTAERQCEVGTWREMVVITSGDWHTVGVRADGTAIATGNNRRGQCEVGDWRGLTTVVAGYLEDVPLVVELQRRPDDHQATFTVSS